jgi:rSAM/selenodomain-associated transferase 2
MPQLHSIQVISIIIPIYNEEKILTKNSPYLTRLSRHSELIFVDGGSTDKTIQIANGCGKVLHSERGRAVQMNHGAKNACGDILIFLHADNTISEEALITIEEAIKNGFIGGCLTQRIDCKRPIYRFIEGEGNIRARITKIFYGDQGIFVKKDIFLKRNGFPEAPIMEDVLFSKNLRKLGRTTVLSDKILVSPRRWEKKGIVKTIFLHNSIMILFWLGFPLEKIKRMYGDLR